MECYLFVDFGSTNTKLTLIDIEKEEIVATAKSYTTVETDIMIGFDKALETIKEKLERILKLLKNLPAHQLLEVLR